MEESIASNAEAARVAKDARDFADQLHAMDYLVYAYLQLGQDQKAKAVIDERRPSPASPKRSCRGPSAGGFAGALRHGTRRLEGGFRAAGPAEPAPASAGHDHFARALGAARSGNPEAAKADIVKLAELRDKLRDAKDAYWSEQVDIQPQIATAWVLYAEGKRDEALNAMSAAADAEDKTEKHPVTPGVPKPARELYGDMLLESEPKKHSPPSKRR